MSPASPAPTLGAIARAHPRPCAAALAGTVGAVAAMYTLTWWAGVAARRVAAGQSLGGLALHLTLGVVIVASLTAASALRDLALAHMSATYSARLRSVMFQSLIRQPMSALRERSAGEAVTRLGSDITALHQALQRTLTVWAPAVATTVALSIAVIAVSPWLSAMTILLIAPVLAITSSWSGRLQSAVHASQDRAAQLGSLIAESLAGVREAKVYRREEAIGGHAADLSHQIFEHAQHEERAALLLPSIVTVAAFAGVCGVLLAAAWQFQRGAIDLGAFTRFLVLLAMLAGPLQESVRSSSAVGRFRALRRRCIGLIESARVEVVADEPTDRLGGGVRFSGTRVTYPATGFRLGPIDLDVRDGESIAIVGPSGSGKSTLLELVPQLVRASAGSIEYPGATRVSVSSVRQACAYVPQDPYIFAGSVIDNLRFARSDAALSEVLAACRAAHVDEFVRRLPDGYRTQLSHGGGNLSVGQRQRLAVARAMLVNPRILLLDEPTAALDIESETLLVESLASFSRGRTMLLVTHRPSLVVLAHRIVHMREGRIERIEPGPRAAEREGLRHAAIAIAG
ncbi:MAG: ABC transporter ATP-binding protein [Gemmatimonadaceae bacterium]